MKKIKKDLWFLNLLSNQNFNGPAQSVDE